MTLGGEDFDFDGCFGFGEISFGGGVGFFPGVAGAGHEVEGWEGCVGFALGGLGFVVAADGDDSGEEVGVGLPHDEGDVGALGKTDEVDL